MTTYHIMLDVIGMGSTPGTACHIDGCNVYAHITCIRCYERFCANHAPGTLKTVSYGNVYIPLCLNCITSQEVEANKTNASTS